MSKCPKSITTATGKFTFHTEKVTRCEAKKICKYNGEILAPLTNKEDIDAVRSISKWPQCPELGNADKDFNIGLDVIPCGENKQDRIFSNGVVWDQAVHGPLYYNSEQYKDPCPQAYFMPFFDNQGLGVFTAYGCRDRKMGFICLKPAASEAEPITAEKSGLFNGSIVVVGAMMILVVGLVLSHVRTSKKNKKLEEKVKDLKHRLLGYEEPTV